MEKLGMVHGVVHGPWSMFRIRPDNKAFRCIFRLRNDERSHANNRYILYMSPICVIFQWLAVCSQNMLERKNLLPACGRHVENNTPPRWPRLVFNIFMTSREQTIYGMNHCVRLSILRSKRTSFWCSFPRISFSVFLSSLLSFLVRVLGRLLTKSLILQRERY